jgi:hypothetical protein
VERVTFFNAESGFAVLRVKVQGNRELVTVLGSLPSVSDVFVVGLEVGVAGRVQSDGRLAEQPDQRNLEAARDLLAEKHGLQFKLITNSSTMC